MNGIFIVVAVTPVESIASTKEPGKVVNRQNIVIRELGGDYADKYVCTCLGAGVISGLQPGNRVFASLRFSVSDYNGRAYQDCVAREIIKI